MAPIYPCLWFEDNARQAADFYVSIFPDSRLLSDNGISVHWQVGDRVFMGLNGRRGEGFSEANSFVITCETQAEIDHFWNSLTADGGEERMCGWLRDKYGVSWQVVPSILGELMRDPERAPRVIQAFLKMRKFDLQALLDA